MDLEAGDLRVAVEEYLLYTEASEEVAIEEDLVLEGCSSSKVNRSIRIS